MSARPPPSRWSSSGREGDMPDRASSSHVRRLARTDWDAIWAQRISAGALTRMRPAGEGGSSPVGRRGRGPPARGIARAGGRSGGCLVRRLVNGRTRRPRHASRNQFNGRRKSRPWPRFGASCLRPVGRLFFCSAAVPKREPRAREGEFAPARSGTRSIQVRNKPTRELMQIPRRNPLGHACLWACFPALFIEFAMRSSARSGSRASAPGTGCGRQETVSWPWSAWWPDWLLNSLNLLPGRLGRGRRGNSRSAPLAVPPPAR